MDISSGESFDVACPVSTGARETLLCELVSNLILKMRHTSKNQTSLTYIRKQNNCFNQGNNRRLCSMCCFLQLHAQGMKPLCDSYW